MKIQNYEITIRKIKPIDDNKYRIGDIVDITGCDKGIGIIIEVRDKIRENTTSYIESARGWYYFVEYGGGASEVKEKDLILVKKFKDLINNYEK